MCARLPDRQSQETCEAIRRNIDAVARLEENYIRERRFADRIADSIADFTGSLKFVVLHLVVYGAWILVNIRLIPGMRLFDPYPFLLLGMVVSLEAIFLATFVLIKQNRMSRRGDQRAHLDLQINLLSEREMTLVLQILQEMSARLGVSVPDRTVQELAEETSVETVATQLQERLPEG